MRLGNSPPGHGVEGPNVNTLTAAEKHVCELAAMGLTNRQIAEERCVGVKAVEFHLHNAYVKLNVANRTQLARHMLEHDAVELDRAGANVGLTPEATTPPSIPVESTPSAMEAAAEQMLSEVLEAVSSEIGGRALSDSELARLHDCVAAEVAHAVSRQFSLDDSQRAALEESLRHQLRLANEADTIAS